MGGSFLRFRPLELRRAAPIRGGGLGNASLTALVVVGKTMSPSLKPSRFSVSGGGSSNEWNNREGSDPLFAIQSAAQQSDRSSRHGYRAKPEILQDVLLEAVVDR